MIKPVLKSCLPSLLGIAAAARIFPQDVFAPTLRTSIIDSVGIFNYNKFPFSKWVDLINNDVENQMSGFIRKTLDTMNNSHFGEKRASTDYEKCRNTLEKSVPSLHDALALKPETKSSFEAVQC